jgi:hypothetical protein
VRRLPPLLTSYQNGPGRWKTISQNPGKLLVNVRVPEYPGNGNLVRPSVVGDDDRTVRRKLSLHPDPRLRAGCGGGRGGRRTVQDDMTSGMLLWRTRLACLRDVLA